MKALVLVAALLVPQLGRAAEWYVDPERGDDANDGSRARPLKTLRAAGDRARGSDVIHAGPGTYSSASGEPGAMVLYDDVQLIGAGSTRTRIEDVPTVFMDCRACLVRDFGFRQFAVLVMRGPLMAPGIYAPRVERCEFEDSFIEIDFLPPVADYDLRPVIEGNVFVNPYRVAILASSFDEYEALVPQWLRLTVTNNVCVGGTTFVKIDDPWWRWGGRREIEATIANNTVVGTTGDAFQLRSNTATETTRLVVSNNLVVGAGGYGVHLPIGTIANKEIANNIFSATALGVYKAPDTGVVATAADLNSVPAASGNLDGAPTFRNAPAGDYRLAPGSLGVDGALAASAPARDFEGGVRPVDGDGDTVAVADVGADELDPSTELLRNADVTDLDPLTPDRATVLPLRSPRDDRASFLPPGGMDDPGVLADGSHPLVFYQLVRPDGRLWLRKVGGELRLEY